MGQIFHPSANAIAKASIFGGIFILGGAIWIVSLLNRSSYITGVDVPVEQPVLFSHKHHVTGLGIDCRYCHTSVETSAFAGIPPTKTCMNCHVQMWSDSPILAPVRDSFASGKPIEWTKLNDLPDFVYFDHSIHVKKGIGCVSCHGRVDQMPMTSRKLAFHMEQCLECHRNPEKFVRPRDKVYDLAWEPEESQAVLGAKLVKEYNIKKVTDCSACHR